MPQSLSSFVPDQQTRLKTFVPDSGAGAPPSYNMAESGMLGAISGATMGIAPWAGGLYYGFPGTEAYKKGVQTEQARYSEAAKQNPISYGLGAIGSSLPGFAATTVPGVAAKGVTMLSRATPDFLKGTGIATGAGALQGVTSTPIGSDASTYMANAGAGAVVGAAGGVVLNSAAKLPISSVGPALTNVIHPAKAVSTGKIAAEAIQQAKQIRHNAIVTANVDNLPNNQLTPDVIQRANDVVDAQLGRPGQKKAPAALTPLSVDGGKTFVNPEDPNYTKIASMLNMPTEVTTNPRYSVEDIVPKVLNKWAGDYKNSAKIPQAFTAPTPTSTLSNAIVGQLPGAVAAGVTSMAASHLGIPPVVSGVVADLAGHGSYLIGKPVYDKWRTNQMTNAFADNLNNLKQTFKSDPTSLTDTISNYAVAKAANNNVHPTDIPVGTQQAPTAADYVNPNDTPNVAPGQGGGFGGWTPNNPQTMSDMGYGLQIKSPPTGQSLDYTGMNPQGLSLDFTNPSLHAMPTPQAPQNTPISSPPVINGNRNVFQNWDPNGPGYTGSMPVLTNPGYSAPSNNPYINRAAPIQNHTPYQPGYVGNFIDNTGQLSLPMASTSNDYNIPLTGENTGARLSALVNKFDATRPYDVGTLTNAVRSGQKLPTNLPEYASNLTTNPIQESWTPISVATSPPNLQPYPGVSDALTPGAQNGMVSRLQVTNPEMVDNTNTLLGLAQKVDPNTFAHATHTGDVAESIASMLGIHPAVSNIIGQTTVYHDLGKMAIPLSVIHGGKLTDAEFGAIETHPEIGAQLLGGENAISEAAANSASMHHEKFNGSGYPNGLAGNDIPLESRIGAVADVFSALASDRSYKKAMPLYPDVTNPKVLSVTGILQQGRGTAFDPTIVDTLLSNPDKMQELYDAAPKYDTSAVSGN